MTEKKWEWWNPEDHLDKSDFLGGVDLPLNPSKEQIVKTLKYHQKKMLEIGAVTLGLLFVFLFLISSIGISAMTLNSVHFLNTTQNKTAISSLNSVTHALASLPLGLIFLILACAGLIGVIIQGVNWLSIRIVYGKIVYGKERDISEGAS